MIEAPGTGVGALVGVLLSHRLDEMEAATLNHTPPNTLHTQKESNAHRYSHTQIHIDKDTRDRYTDPTQCCHLSVGACEGLTDGRLVGLEVGNEVGSFVGIPVGCAVGPGVTIGETVGV